MRRCDLGKWGGERRRIGMWYIGYRGFTTTMTISLDLLEKVNMGKNASGKNKRENGFELIRR